MLLDVDGIFILKLYKNIFYSDRKKLLLMNRV